MTKTRKAITAVIATVLLLIVVAVVIIATFDWNRLKPTINEKVSAELNRQFAIRGVGKPVAAQLGSGESRHSYRDAALTVVCARQFQKPAGWG